MRKMRFLNCVMLSCCVVLGLLAGFSMDCVAQMRILPRERVDSLVKAAEGPRCWAADFLYVDSLSFNAGTASEGSIIAAEYHIRNTGDEDLAIGRVETTCGCVTASLSPAFLPAHESAVLHVEYNTLRHPGRHPRYISIYLREPVDTCIARLELLSRVLEK